MSEIYRLKSHNYIAQVVPEYGMNCIKAVCEKPYADMLRTPQNVNVLGNDDAFLFGMPVLFFSKQNIKRRF